MVPDGNVAVRERLMDIDFYYDIVCPYAYVASTRIGRIAAAAGATVRWKPVLLGGIYTSIGADPTSRPIPAKSAMITRDILRQGQRAGAPIRKNPRHPMRSVEAMRLLTACPEATRPALTAALYRHYQADEGSLERDALAPIAAAHGLDIAVIDDPTVKDALRATTDEAVRLGAFGVPTIIVNGELVWGNDRLDRVCALLGVPPDPPVVERVARTTRPKLTFFHDLSSPYAYIAAKRVAALADETGAELVWSPMLLGALFQAIGTPTVPIATFPAAKQAWAGRDMRAQAELYGVPFQFPTAFPLRTVTALRVCLAEPAATLPLYDAAWSEDADIGQPAILAGVLERAGFNAADLLARAETPEIKGQLRERTQAAVDAGVCGAPSFLVDDTWLFWGQDRMDMVRDALTGWTPAA